jgi:hypothetical protein
MNSCKVKLTDINNLINDCIIRERIICEKKESIPTKLLVNDANNYVFLFKIRKNDIANYKNNYEFYFQSNNK